jgi:chromosome segregation ATPase
MNTNNGYKSEVANRVLDTIPGIAISQDRERMILGPGDYSPSSTYDGMIKDMEDLQQKIRNVGVNGAIERVVYGIGDSIGITSPEKRLYAQRRTLETEASRLDRMIKSHFDSIQRLAQDIQEVKNLKRDAKAIMYKYKAIEEQLGGEAAKMDDERGKIRDELAKLDPKDPNCYRMQEALDSLSMEHDKLEDDIDTVRYKMNRAAKAVLKNDNKLQRLVHTKQVVKSTLDALEDGYNKLDLKIDEFVELGSNNGSSVMKSLTGLKGARETYEKVSRVLGDTPTEINRALTQISLDLVPERLETTPLGQMTKDLKRSNERRESELMNLAEEIVRKDLKS